MAVLAEPKGATSSAKESVFTLTWMTRKTQ